MYSQFSNIFLIACWRCVRKNGPHFHSKSDDGALSCVLRRRPDHVLGMLRCWNVDAKCFLRIITKSACSNNLITPKLKFNKLGFIALWKKLTKTPSAMHIQRLRMNSFYKIFRAGFNSNVLSFSLNHFWSKFQLNFLKFYRHDKNGQKKIYLEENDAKMMRFIIEDT